MSNPKQKPLTAHQLAQYLLHLPDFPIILAEDQEGNSYSTTSLENIVTVRFEKRGNEFMPKEEIMEEDLHPKMNCKNVYIVLYPSA